jgi:hypothetical protein
MKKVAVLVAGLLTLFVIACGGSDSDSDSTSSDEAATLALADAIEQGDQICVETSDKFTELADEYSAQLKKGDYVAAGDALDEIADLTTDRGSQLGEMSVEGDEQSALDGYIAKGDESAEQMNAMAESLRNEDIAGVTAATKTLAEINVEEAAFAQQFGFEQCGSGVIGA